MRRVFFAAIALLFSGCTMVVSAQNLLFLGTGSSGGAASYSTCSTGWTGPTSGLTHCWPMNDANVSGTTIIDVIGSNNLTANGGIASTAGPGSSGAATARSIDGMAGSYLVTSTSPVASWASGAHSVGMWIKITNTSAAGSGGFRQTYLCFEIAPNTDYLRILNDTVIGAGTLNVSTSDGTGTVTASGTIPSATWTSVLYTNNGSGTKAIYINGSAVSTSTTSDSSCNGVDLNFAGSIDTSVGSMAGAMYGYMIYNVALSSSDALVWHNAK